MGWEQKQQNKHEHEHEQLQVDAVAFAMYEVLLRSFSLNTVFAVHVLKPGSKDKFDNQKKLWKFPCEMETYLKMKASAAAAAGEAGPRRRKTK